MSLREKIFELRKKKGLSQEQLGEKINVTRQTISNWELGETSPNPDQMKLLSKEFNVSIDELLDNDVQSIIVEKVSNTEKLAGLVLKILKWLGIAFIIILIIDIISLILFSFFKSSSETHHVEEVEFVCTIEDEDYFITVGNDGYFNCSNCSKKLYKELKDNEIDFENIDVTRDNVFEYFEKNNGYCE